MPELPEVENIRRRIQSKLSENELVDLHVPDETLLKNCSVDEVADAVLNKSIDSIDRKGKYLLFRFESSILVNHLRMSGRWLFDEGERTRLALTFNGNTRLFLDDLRRLGTLHLVPENQIDDLPPLANLGLEPLTETFTRSKFADVLSSRQEIKRLLMDQQKLAGLGNIYTSEILHSAGIHPFRKASSLTDEEIDRLFRTIPEVLRNAIAHDGTSFDMLYRTPSGDPGNFQDLLTVYDREGKDCKTCSSEIQRMKQGQRSSYFCPNCQSLPS